MCSLWFSQMPLISIYSIFWSDFIMDKVFVLRWVGTAVMYINHTNVSLQMFVVIKYERPNMSCHFWIQVLEASWFVYLRPAWAGCQIMKPTYGRHCTKNKHFSASPPTHVPLATHFRLDVSITSILMHFRPASPVGLVAAEVALGHVLQYMYSTVHVLQSHHVMSIHERCILIYLPTVDATQCYQLTALVTHFKKLRPPLAAILVLIPLPAYWHLCWRGTSGERRFCRNKV